MENTFQITISDELLGQAEARMRECCFKTINEYVSMLIANDTPLPWTPELRDKILEGLEGPRVEMTPEEWENIRREARESLRQRETA